MNSSTMNNNRWHESPTQKLWYTMDATHVVGQVVKVGAPGEFTVACTGPNGLGVHYNLVNTTPYDAIRFAESALADLGWIAGHDTFARPKEFARAS